MSLLRTPSVLWLVLLALVWPPISSADPRPPPDSAVLRVGTSGDYAPFSRAGRGFDVDVAKLLAAEFGARIEWVRFRWPELSEAIAQDRFDVAMSGVTWRAARALDGYMARAVASGGPCVLGDSEATRIAVNRGGILERWTRGRYPGAQIQALDDNTALPEKLVSGAVDAIVSDSFEVHHFRRPGQAYACEPAIDRKVYWVAPARARELGPRIDSFLREHEAQIDDLRVQHFGVSTPRDDLDHLIDLLARRLAFMPSVAAWKRANGKPIEDLERERQVLERAVAQAKARSISAESARGLFRVQVELAKAIQSRTPQGVQGLDLTRVRNVLSALGDRILESLAGQIPLPADGLTAGTQRLIPLHVQLEPQEFEMLRSQLLALRAD